ncbi:MAG: hypothetical protein SO135_01505 [Sphaerochaetaceae bacterium]|jgi:hypothetical protein|nr:hypothetical protein [Sphaerochaetaceae bacterium]NLY07050.1 hypothetical protein [Spirochaetales bacterium]
MTQYIGIIEIRNLLSDRRLYISSDDTFSDCAKIRFQLDLGTYPLKSLQDDYNETGLELFIIHKVETLGAPAEKQLAIARWNSSCPQGSLYC